MDGRYKKWQTKDRWLSCNKTQHTKIAWQRFIQRNRTTVHAREISRGREKGMKNGCFKAVMRHGCLGQRQWGTTCPNFVVWEAKHFFFCWLLRICAISHMCTSLVSSTTVAHISLTCVLLPAQIHKDAGICPWPFNLVCSSFLHFFIIYNSKDSWVLFPRWHPSLFLSAVDIGGCSLPMWSKMSCSRASQHLEVMLNVCLVSSPLRQITSLNQL